MHPWFNGKKKARKIIKLEIPKYAWQSSSGTFIYKGVNNEQKRVGGEIWVDDKR